MKVKLEEIIDAVDFAGPELEYYYSTRTEEVLLVSDGMVNGEKNPELIEEIEEGFIDEYIPLPGQYEINEYNIMEKFIYSLPAGRKQDILEDAIRGRGAFRRFADALYDLDLEQRWYKFQENAHERIAREWCERHGIEIEE